MSSPNNPSNETNAPPIHPAPPSADSSGEGLPPLNVEQKKKLERLKNDDPNIYPLW